MTVPFTPLPDAEVARLILEAAHTQVDPSSAEATELTTYESIVTTSLLRLSSDDDASVKEQARAEMYETLIGIAYECVYDKPPYIRQAYDTVLDIPPDYLSDADMVQWIAQDVVRVQAGKTIHETYSHAHDFVIQSPEPSEYATHRATYTRIPGATCTCLRCLLPECSCDTCRTATFGCCHLHCSDDEFEDMSKEEA